MKRSLLWIGAEECHAECEWLCECAEAHVVECNERDVMLDHEWLCVYDRHSAVDREKMDTMSEREASSLRLIPMMFKHPF